MLASGSSNRPAATAVLSHVHGSGADIGVRRHALRGLLGFRPPDGMGGEQEPTWEAEYFLTGAGVYRKPVGMLARSDEGGLLVVGGSLLPGQHSVWPHGVSSGP